MPQLTKVAHPTKVAHKVTLIPGDGIGPEVSAAAVRVLEATGAQLEWESFAAGADAFERYHEYIPKELVGPGFSHLLYSFHPIQQKQAC